MKSSSNKFLANKPMTRLAIRGAKNLGKGVWKNKRKIARGFARGAGAVAGATIGLSAAVASGDPSKALTYTSAGALAGNTIGKNSVNFVTDTASSSKDMAQEKYSNLKNAVNEELYGVEYARQEQIKENNRKARKALMKDENERAKWNLKAADMGYDGDMQDFMSAVADYKEAGITDESTIENALKVENQRGGIGGDLHENMIDVTSYASKNGLGMSTFDDEKKFASFEKLVDSTGLAGDKQEEVKRLTAQLVGREDLYRKRKQEQNMTKRQTRKTTKKQQRRNKNN